MMGCKRACSGPSTASGHRELTSALNLAWYLAKQGKYAEAERMLLTAGGPPSRGGRVPSGY
jgi:hypothetical protein